MRELLYVNAFAFYVTSAAAPDVSWGVVPTHGHGLISPRLCRFNRFPSQFANTISPTEVPTPSPLLLKENQETKQRHASRWQWKMAPLSFIVFFSHLSFWPNSFRKLAFCVVIFRVAALHYKVTAFLCFIQFRFAFFVPFHSTFYFSRATVLRKLSIQSSAL